MIFPDLEERKKAARHKAPAWKALKVLKVQTKTEAAAVRD